ncbi:hypothetical protein PENSPDRAFT_574999 [Peniophora sp. CONT]|nr:hypothetical protein PENSPDRAFT_574999 [Peniophora sp. CONT]
MSLPSARSGYLVLVLTTVFFLCGFYALLLGHLLPLPVLPVLQVVIADYHYTCFAILIIPTTSYFVIANWVGWQYYSNS